VSPLSELAETPDNVIEESGLVETDHATTSLIMSPNTSPSDPPSSFELILTLIIGHTSDKILDS